VIALSDMDIKKYFLVDARKYTEKMFYIFKLKEINNKILIFLNNIKFQN